MIVAEPCSNVGTGREASGDIAAGETGRMTQEHVRQGNHGCRTAHLEGAMQTRRRNAILGVLE
jgi:hypothetical protein